MRNRSVLSFVLFSFAPVCVAWSGAIAQGADEWASLSITEFVAEAERLLAAEQTDEQRAALDKTLGQHAAGRLRGLNPGDTLDRHTFLDLYKLGRLELNEREQETISLRAVPPQSETAGWTLQKYYEEFAKIVAPRVPRSTRNAFASRWFANHSILEYGDRIHDEMFPVFRDKSDRQRSITAQMTIGATSKYCLAKLKNPDVRSTIGVEDRLKYLGWAVWRMPEEPLELLALLVCPTAAEAADWDFAKMRGMHAKMRLAGVPASVMDQVVHAWVGARTAKVFAAQAAELYAAAAEDPLAALLLESYRRYAAKRLQAVAAGQRRPWEDRLTYYHWGRKQVPGEQTAAVIAAVAPSAAETTDWDFPQVQAMHVKMCGSGMPERFRDAVVHIWCDGRTAEDFGRQATELDAAPQRDRDANFLLRTYHRYAVKRLEALVAAESRPWEDRLTYYRWGSSRILQRQEAEILAAVRPSAAEAADWDFPQVRAMHAKMCGSGMPAEFRDGVVHTWREGRTAEDFDRQAAELDAAAREDRDAMALLQAYQSYAVKWLEALVAGENRPWEDRLTYYRWGRKQVPWEQRAAVMAAVGPSAAEMADWTSEAAEPAALASMAERLSLLGDAGRAARQSLAGHVTAKYLGGPTATRSVTAAQWHSFARCLGKDLSGAVRTQWAAGLRAAFAEPAAAILVFNAADLSKLAAALSLLDDEQAYRLVATWTEGTDAWQSLQPEALAALAGDLSKDHDTGTAARLLLADHVRQKYLADASAARSITAGPWSSLVRSLGWDLSPEVRTQWISGLGEAFVAVEQPVTGPRFAQLARLNGAFREIAAMEDWRQFLDVKLAAADTDGQPKANWLVARALAASIVPGKADAQLLQGRPWLEQLLDRRQSTALRIHAIEQLTLGYAADQQYGEAAQLLNKTAEQGSDDEIAAAVKSLHARLVRDEVKYLTTKIAEMRRRAATKDEQVEGTEDEARKQIYLKWGNYFRQEEQKFLARLEQIEQ